MLPRCLPHRGLQARKAIRHGRCAWSLGFPRAARATFSRASSVKWLRERIGQAFVIDNRPGAAGNVAAESVARATPDGYTLIIIGSPHAINATLYDKPNFDFIRDIAPVASIDRVPFVMEVNPSFPAKTVPEFIAYAKSNPGKINFASAGNGSPQHVAGELFKMMAGVDMVHVTRAWHRKGPKVDVVCSSDVVSPLGFTISCKKFVMHIGDPFIQSGEIAQRRSEDKGRLPGGPAELANVGITFEPRDEPQVVWSLSGDLKVSAIRSFHIAGHASYRVDTPAGSVVIGGDASNDVLSLPRATSTSDEVEKLAKGADIIVHSATHPVLGPDSGLPQANFIRQSSAPDRWVQWRNGWLSISCLLRTWPPYRR